MDLLVALFPIAWLIWIMTKPRPWPSQLALPVAAVLALATRILYFHDPANQWGTALVAGWLLAWTPILIVGGAIFFFKAMEASGAMEVVRQWLNAVTPSRIARLLIIGWAFQYLIEGASGFGTPAALAGPLLVGLGFPALRVAAFCLILDSVPVAFGAVGTPVWFGLGQLDVAPELVREAGIKAALLNGISGFVIVPVALLLLVPWNEIRRHLVFIALSVTSCVLPAWLFSFVSNEFPTVIGGMIGLLLTVALARYRIGLPPELVAKEGEPAPVAPMPPKRRLIMALSPLGLTVLLLLLTRIRQLGLKGWLQSLDPAIEISLGAAGELRLSTALVMEWRDMFGTDFAWTHPLLYVPSLIPFALIGLWTLWIGRVGREEQRTVWGQTFKQMKNPTLALFGALIFVRLLMSGGEAASSMIIGGELAQLTGPHWTWAAVFLGALGSFFAGSATVSNLTFGGIQLAIAENLGLDPTTILALQAVGASTGNMIAIHNIVAVCSILGLKDVEGTILKKTVGPMILYGFVATIAAVLLWR